MMKRAMFSTALLAVTLAGGLSAHEPAFTFTRQWTHGHTSPKQVSEIPAFDRRTNTIWVAGVAGVDVLSAEDGALIEHLDLTNYGAVNSVAIRRGLAAVAIEAPGDRRNPGVVLFIDTVTRTISEGPNLVQVGALPDMLTFTPDGRLLLVANEATPNAVADTAYAVPDPEGSVSIIDMRTRTVVATAGFAGVPITGTDARTTTGMDFEPEYIAVDHEGHRAFVTLQEANAVAILDLKSLAFTEVVGLGVKDFNLPGNEVDTKDDGVIAFTQVAAKGLYMPDSVATYRSRGRTYMVLANEGDFREDNADRVVGSTLGGVAPLDRLRVARPPSAAGNLVAAGARSFSIRDAAGRIVFDSGNLLDVEAARRGIYDDGRSRDKGVEPEGVALLEIENRTLAFIGLERTTKSAVAVFDVTNPRDVRFIDMIVTAGDLAPEGLAAYRHHGRFFLAIANETVAPGATTSNTTLYEIGLERRRERD